MKPCIVKRIFGACALLSALAFTACAQSLYIQQLTSTDGSVVYNPASGGGARVNLKVGSASGGTIRATNLLAATFYLPSSLQALGDSIAAGYGSEPSYGQSATNAGYVFQVANWLNIPVTNQAIGGIGTLGTQWREAMQGSLVYAPNQAIIYDCGINDLGAALLTSNLNPGTAQAQLATLAWASFATADSHPWGSDLLTPGNIYGYTNGGSSWTRSSTTNWYPLCPNGGSILSTVAGDSITLTNVYGTSFILGFDGWWTNNVGGILGVIVDGITNCIINCNPSTPIVPGGAVVSNFVMCRIVSNLTAAVHTVQLVDLAPPVAYDYCLAPGKRSSTNQVLVLETYATPNGANGYNGISLAQIMDWNANQVSNVTLLNSVGVAAKIVPAFSLINTNFQYTGDFVHPNFYGHLLLAGSTLGVLTGSASYVSIYMAAQGVINPPSAQFPMNGTNVPALSWTNAWVGPNSFAGTTGLNGGFTVDSVMNGDPVAGNFGISGQLNSTNGIATFRSNGSAPVQVSFAGAGTTSWTNTFGYNVECYLGTGSSGNMHISKNGQQLDGGLNANVVVTLLLQPGEYLTYSYGTGTPGNSAKWYYTPQ